MGHHAPMDHHGRTAAFLETGRLVLRPFAGGDHDALVALHNDPEVMRFINGGRPVAREEALRVAATDGFWAADEQGTGEFLGWFEFRDLTGRGDEVELGYRLRRAAWGRGYATEGARALVCKGFGELGVRRVTATTMAVNVRSRRVMEKAGLVYVRTFHDEWDDPVAGAELGDVEYALTRQEWLAGAGRAG
jgi:RimJ/RimL family protein N-acetyltransferase